MALTAEDIVNKRFQSTKFREGYDQDEVDDMIVETPGHFSDEKNPLHIAEAFDDL